MLIRAPLYRTVVSISSLSLLCFTGCSSGPQHHGRNSDGGGQAAAIAALSMSAQDSFFGDTILVEANLGHGFTSNGDNSGGSGSSSGGGGGGGGGGRGGFGGRGGGGGGGRRRGGGGGGAGGGSGGGSSSDGEGPAPRMHESNLPPLALRLRLTNHGKDTVEVTFVDCNSELGDFAVQPEKVALAAGQSAEPDAMNSRLGVPTEELHMTLALKIGAKTENKILILKPNKPTTPPAPPAGSPPVTPPAPSSSTPPSTTPDSAPPKQE